MRLRVLIALCLAASAISPETPGAPRDPTEHEVKAAFLYHFAQLVTWPGTGAARDEPIVIAVIGRDPFGSILDATMSGQTVRGRAIQIVRARSSRDLETPPAILFLGAATLPEAERMLAAVGDAPVLTVGELQGLAGHGAIVEFRITEDGRVTFDVNLERAERVGLKISSQLLKIARIVGDQP